MLSHFSNMKKIAFFLCFVLLFSVFGLNVFADTSDTSITPTPNSGIDNLSTLEIGITAAIMFTIIAVIGVMFMKIVIKNKNDRR